MKTWDDISVEINADSFEIDVYIAYVFTEQNPENFV